MHFYLIIFRLQFCHVHFQMYNFRCTIWNRRVLYILFLQLTTPDYGLTNRTPLIVYVRDKHFRQYYMYASPLYFSAPGVMPFCEDVSGGYRTADNFHELVLVHDTDDDTVFGLYRNVSVFIYLGLLGNVGHPDYDSRVVSVTYPGRETALILGGMCIDIFWIPSFAKNITTVSCPAAFVLLQFYLGILIPIHA